MLLSRPEFFLDALRKEPRTMRRKISSNGVVCYLGPSELDGKRIVLVTTGLREPSRNRKTSFMLQTWIMNADLPPLDAARRGLDISVCGHCPLRGEQLKNRVCYVTLFDAPTRIWKLWNAGRYPSTDVVGWSWAKHRAIRFGSYGDPAAVPGNVWVKLAERSSIWTGYSRFWRQEKFQYLRHLVMASVENEEDAFEAQSRQWRTYRIRLPNEPLLPFESVCPASEEAGWKSSCLICGQCDGARGHDLRHSYAIQVHGSGARAFRKIRSLPVLQ
jgi:hypothetical protein